MSSKPASPVEARKIVPRLSPGEAEVDEPCKLFLYFSILFLLFFKWIKIVIPYYDSIFRFLLFFFFFFFFFFI